MARPDVNASSSQGTIFATHIPAQLDFAHVAGNTLVIYGWIAGLSSEVSSARLQSGNWRCDLLNEALALHRPDVTAHLGGAAVVGNDDGHGFFVLSDLGDLVLDDSPLRLTLTTRQGNTFHQQWQIARGSEDAAQTLRQHERTMRQLVPRLSPRQVHLLTHLFQPPLQLRAGDLQADQTTLGTPLHVPLACALDPALVVIGGTLPVPLTDFESLILRKGDVTDNALAQLTELPNSVTWSGPLPPGGLAPTRPRSFLAILPWLEEFRQRAEVDLLHRAQGTAGSQRLTLRLNPQDAQTRLNAWLCELEPGNRLAACEALLVRLPDGDQGRPWREVLILLIEATVGELPVAAEGKEELASAAIFPERVLPVPGAGLILEGWANADPGLALSVHYCSGGSMLPGSERWVRRARPDVRAHLAQQGFGNVDEPGFCCLIPVAWPPRPAYLRVQAGRQTWRLQVRLPGSVEPTRRLVRSILSTIDPNCSELRRHLDQHIGPAVQATWSARPGARGMPLVQRFGPQPAQPMASLVIPLFGRHDFADYQLALFTDDPELHQAEIIYVVDDPAIIHDFRARCPDLHAMHGLGFTLAYPGDNLGFAGATNFGAAHAQAPLLLLLNSDVFPKARGWLGQLCRQYRAHPDTALLGVKLLYEDGSVQHAGMVTRPLAQWQGLWINDHVHKGLDPTPLTGLVDVPAVTAACALIDTELYRAVGGLSEDYIIGDFEDSDLCFRVRATGRICRVDLDVTLYHLERQSQDLGDHHWRMALTLYNCWLHDTRWGAALAEGRL